MILLFYLFLCFRNAQLQVNGYHRIRWKAELFSGLNHQIDTLSPSQSDSNRYNTKNPLQNLQDLEDVPTICWHKNRLKWIHQRNNAQSTNLESYKVYYVYAMWSVTRQYGYLRGRTVRRLKILLLYFCTSQAIHCLWAYGIKSETVYGCVSITNWQIATRGGLWYTPHTICRTTKKKIETQCMQIIHIETQHFFLRMIWECVVIYSIEFIFSPVFLFPSHKWFRFRLWRLFRYFHSITNSMSFIRYVSDVEFSVQLSVITRLLLYMSPTNKRTAHTMNNLMLCQLENKPLSWPIFLEKELSPILLPRTNNWIEAQPGSNSNEMTNT